MKMKGKKEIFIFLSTTGNPETDPQLKKYMGMYKFIAGSKKKISEGYLYTFLRA